MGIKRDIKKAIRKYVLAFLELSYLKENPPFLLKSTKYLKVGFNSYHNGNLKVKGANKMIVIGSYCALGENITILKSNHNYNYASIQYSFYNENFGELPYKENINDTPIIEIGNDPEALEDRLAEMQYQNLAEAKVKLMEAYDAFELYFKENPDTVTKNAVFGMLTKFEWNLTHTKHFNHHFEQFGLL